MKKSHINGQKLFEAIYQVFQKWYKREQMSEFERTLWLYNMNFKRLDGLIEDSNAVSPESSIVQLKSRSTCHDKG